MRKRFNCARSYPDRYLVHEDMDNRYSNFFYKHLSCVQCIITVTIKATIDKRWLTFRNYKFTFRIDVGGEEKGRGEPLTFTCGERKIEINEAFSRSVVGSTIRIEGVAIPITRGWNAYRSIDRSIDEYHVLLCVRLWWLGAPPTKWLLSMHDRPEGNYLSIRQG